MSTDPIARTEGSLNLRLGAIYQGPAEASRSFRGGELSKRGANMFRHEGQYATETDKPSARAPADPFPVLASTALEPRQRECDTIMDALLRECLKAQALDPPHLTRR